MFTLNFPSTITGIIIYILGLLILWAIVSIPVYFAGKAITAGRSDFGDAMGATLGGAIAYFLVFFGVAFFLGAVIGSSANVFALILAVIVWLAVYRAAFRTSWIKAIGIVVLSWLILVIIDFIVVHAFGVAFPDFFPFL
jgi:hypothetical protein